MSLLDRRDYTKINIHRLTETVQGLRLAHSGVNRSFMYTDGLWSGFCNVKETPLRDLRTLICCTSHERDECAYRYVRLVCFLILVGLVFLTCWVGLDCDTCLVSDKCAQSVSSLLNVCSVCLIYFVCLMCGLCV